MPPVANRHGIFWNKKAIGTRDFDIAFTLSGRQDEAGKTNLPESDSALQDGMLAFWLGPVDYSATFDEQAIVTTSKDWAEGMKAAGLTFICNRPNFTGLAVVFGGESVS